MANQNPITVAQASAALVNAVINDNTTVGKTGKTLLWSGGTVALLSLLQALATTIVASPTLFSWHAGVIVVAANVILVFIKNITDSQTPNV
jgi:hypothetical protein